MLSVLAVQVSLICPEAGSVKARLPGAVGGAVSPVDGPSTSNSDSCPAGQPVLAVMVSRRYRTVAGPKSIVTVFWLAGSKRWPAEATRSVKFVPLVLPCTEKVCVRGPQFGTG